MFVDSVVRGVGVCSCCGRRVCTQCGMNAWILKDIRKWSCWQYIDSLKCGYTSGVFQQRDLGGSSTIFFLTESIALEFQFLTLYLSGHASSLYRNIPQRLQQITPSKSPTKNKKNKTNCWIKLLLKLKFNSVKILTDRETDTWQRDRNVTLTRKQKERVIERERRQRLHTLCSN